MLLYELDPGRQYVRHSKLSALTSSVPGEGAAVEPRQLPLLTDVADSLASLDLHDELILGRSLTSQTIDADARPSEGSGGSQQDGINESSYDRFFDATEEDVSEEAPSTAAVQQQQSGMTVNRPVAQRSSNEFVSSNASRGVLTALGQIHGALSSPGTPLEVDSPVNGLTSSHAGAAKATDLPLATVPSLRCSAEAVAGSAPGASLAAASSIGLSIRSSVTFPSLAELASPVTPDFATQARTTAVYCVCPRAMAA